MAEELIQRGLLQSPEQIGDWSFYNIGSTSLRQLKAAKIIPNRDYNEFERKKPDALVVQKPNVIAAIEYKDPSEFNTPAKVNKAIKQEIDTAVALKAKVFILTDGTRSVWINPYTGHEIQDSDGTVISELFDKDSPSCIKLLRRASVSVGPNNDRISETVVVDPLPLARRVWQDLWAVSGATPENCLYSFVEIFIFKFLSDLEILANGRRFEDQLAEYNRGSDEEALRFYAQMIRPEIKRHFPPSSVDGTTVINGMIFVTKDGEPVQGYATTFKTILKRFEQFGKLDAIDRDFKSRLFETFLKESISKKNWGQFFTPLKVVRAIVNMADMFEGMSICDPACGVGKFLLEPLVSEEGRFVRVENGRLISTLKLTGLDKGFDKEEQRTIILAKANMMIYLSSLIKSNPDLCFDLSNLLNSTFLLQTDSILGTLAKPVSERYDLILTNPPYVMSGSGNLKEEISRHEELRRYYAVNAMGVEGLFMEWIVRALKRGGKAFVVVPDGVMIRAHDQRLRDFILRECYIDAVISLPLNTFFTTNKKTYILALTKKRFKEVNGVRSLPDQDDPVFTYLCSEVGETRDVNRFPLEQNDLETASDLFNMFKSARNAFSVNDMRCKIQPVERFKNGELWAVDRWWTQDEKVALGIEDEPQIVSVEEYIAMINDAADRLSGIGAELEELTSSSRREAATANPMMRKVRLSEVFDIVRGSGRYTKAYLRTHEGDIPVFSGNTQGPFGFTDGSDFDVPCLSWSIDGLAGRLMRHRTPFCATNHRGVLVPKNPLIDIDYVRLVLDPVFMDLRKGRLGARGANEYTSLPPYMIKDSAISIPVASDGAFDLGMQRLLAKTILETEECFGQIEDIKDRLSTVDVAPDLDGYRTASFRLGDLMMPSKGKALYTKKYGVAHKGSYPVYSASNEAPLTHINTYDYEGRFLTWATNGFAGRMLILDGKFSVNGDRAVLLPKNEEIEKKVDIEYLRYVLEPQFRLLAKGRKGDRGTSEFTKLYASMVSDVSILLPVNDDGEPDVAMQIEIANRYRLLKECREELLDTIENLLSMGLSVRLEQNHE